MILRNLEFREFSECVKNSKKKIVVYGAGMIGKIVVPFIIKEYGLYNNLECYVDADEKKIGEKILISSNRYEIKSTDYLHELSKNMVLLITNSNFFKIIQYLDSMDELNNIEAYIVPIMQITELKSAPIVTITKKSDKMLIPKKIHYCWFSGKPMPDFLKQCMETWKIFCPDYELICWNEENYDINRIPYIREAYEVGKYSFVSDVVRLDILYQYGGIYLDTDVSLIKNLDSLLYQQGFVGVEKWGNINTGGLVGVIPKHSMIKEMLEYRKQFHFINDDGSLNMDTNGIYETIPFIQHGMRINNTIQIINGMTVYPSSVFHPYDYMSCEEEIKDWTYAKHYFYGGWMKKEELNNRSFTQNKYQQILLRMERSKYEI